ncbi:MAG: helicase-associated domain-containing protein, partial [Anaerolineaceae bacterium]
DVSAVQGTYQITPASLLKAREQGLLPKHLILLLRKHAESGLPPILYQAIKSWEAEGTQANIQTQTILRLGTPEILQALRESSAAHWLGESLGPTAVILKPGAEKSVIQALSALGYLTDYNESEHKDG